MEAAFADDGDFTPAMAAPDGVSSRTKRESRGDGRRDEDGRRAAAALRRGGRRCCRSAQAVVSSTLAWRAACRPEGPKSGKTGQRETARKPTATRRHESLADGAFGQENPPHLKTEQQRNLKISGQASTQHSKYRRNSKGESR